jgi:hypothetical protein
MRRHERQLGKLAKKAKAKGMRKHSMGRTDKLKKEHMRY